MSTYAIGDIQGCFEPFLRLLQKIQFRADRDRLWLAGDLVNRGPKSLDVLHWVVAHEENVDVVLGNHEMYLLRRALGARTKRLDTLDEVLDAPDLVEWVRQLPLVHREGDDVMVHAGVLPDWTWSDIERRAERVQTKLRKGKTDFSGDNEDSLAVFTRLRMIDDKSRPKYSFAGAPQDAPKGQRPWFEAKRKTEDLTIFFGPLGRVRSRDRTELDRPRLRVRVGRQADRRAPRRPSRLSGARGRSALQCRDQGGQHALDPVEV